MCKFTGTDKLTLSQLSDMIDNAQSFSDHFNKFYEMGIQDPHSLFTVSRFFPYLLSLEQLILDLKALFEIRKTYSNEKAKS